MKTGAAPEWLKISELPRVAEMIDGMLEAAEEVYSSLQQAREKPHVMDDFTINHVYEMHGGQLEDLWLYEEQLHRFEKEKTHAEQGKEIDRLTAQLMKLRTTLTPVFQTVIEKESKVIRTSTRKSWQAYKLRVNGVCNVSKSLKRLLLNWRLRRVSFAAVRCSL